MRAARERRARHARRRLAQIFGLDRTSSVLGKAPRGEPRNAPLRSTSSSSESHRLATLRAGASRRREHRRHVYQDAPNVNVFGGQVHVAVAVNVNVNAYPPPSLRRKRRTSCRWECRPTRSRPCRIHCAGCSPCSPARSDPTTRGKRVPDCSLRCNRTVWRNYLGPRSRDHRCR